MLLLNVLTEMISSKNIGSQRSEYNYFLKSEVLFKTLLFILIL